MATYTYGRSISATSLLFLLAFLLSYPAASAFNITKILEQSPDFGTFNSYLTQTQLAAAINSRETITVLAVENSAMSAVSGQPLDVVKKVLSVHVVLDYYDDEKLKNLNKKSTILTTLFQSTGMANDQMGFLNVTKTPSGVQMGSAVPGAALTVQLVKTVSKQPYNISVLQVSGVIMPPGIQNANQSGNANATTATTPPPAHAPAATPKAAPSPKKAPAPGAGASAPAPAASSPEADSPAAASPPSPSAPSEAPAGDAPAPSKDASAPAADASSPSGDAPSDAPTSKAGAPDAAADPPAADGEGEAPGPSEASSGTRVVSGAGVAAVMGAALLAAF